MNDEQKAQQYSNLTYGYVRKGDTHHFNSAVLDERYTYTQKPLTVDWNPETNEVEFV